MDTIEQTQYSAHAIVREIASIAALTPCCITTHRNADGDAMGSALAMWHTLRLRGVDARVVLPTPVPANLMWLPGADLAEAYAPAVHDEYLQRVEVAIIVDLNAAARFAPMNEHLVRPSCRRIVIDHHVEPELFAQCMHIDVDSAATCAMLVEVLRPLLPDGFPPSVAQCLYTGIYTDTGGFRFPRTNGALFRMVAELVDRGADPVQTHERLYNQAPLPRMVLLGKALASLQLFHQGSTAIMALSRSELEAHGATSEDLDGFVHFTLGIAGVDVGVLIAEVGDQIKLSFRSKGSMYVRDVAAAFGGGGHVYAAGARMPSQPLEAVTQQVVEHIGAYRASALSIRSTP